MDEVTLRLEPELVAKLETEAEEKGFSDQTEYIRFLLRNRPEHADQAAEASDQNTSGHDRAYKALIDRIDELEERVDALESDSSDEVDSETSAGGNPPPEQATNVKISTGVGARTRDESGTVDADDVPEDDGVIETVRTYIEEKGLPPESDHGQGAVIGVFRLLREHGTMGTGELQEELYSNYEEHWADPQAMWNAIDYYLEDVPGIEKGDCDEWTYNGDDVVRGRLERDCDE